MPAQIILTIIKTALKADMLTDIWREGTGSTVAGFSVLVIGNVHKRHGT